MSTNKCCKSAVILVLNDTMYYLIVHEFSWAELAVENISAKQRISSTLLVLFSWAITAIRKNPRHSLYGHVDIGSCKRGLRSKCQSGDVVHGNICPLRSWALEEGSWNIWKIVIECSKSKNFQVESFQTATISSSMRQPGNSSASIPVGPEMALCKDGQRNIQASVHWELLPAGFLKYIIYVG